MPVHEVCRAVHRRRHIHVHNYEVIVAGLSTGILSSREFAGSLEKTLNRTDVIFSLVLGHISTSSVSVAVQIFGYMVQSLLFLADSDSVLGTARRPRQPIRERSSQNFLSIRKGLLLDILDGESLPCSKWPRTCP